MARSLKRVVAIDRDRTSTVRSFWLEMIVDDHVPSLEQVR